MQNFHKINKQLKTSNIMASTNQSPQYHAAEKKFLSAITDEEKIIHLEEMLRECPKHKSSENMLSNLKTRYKKLKQKISKQKKSGKQSSKNSIKKSEMQAAIAGMPNTGKSSFFNVFTKQQTKTAQTPYTTYEPKLGTTDFEDTKIQLIDTPTLPNTDKTIIHTTDTLLFIIDSVNQIQEIQKIQKNTNAKIITIFNKEDLLTPQEKRKISETLKSKKQDFFLFSSTNPDKEIINQIKKKLFNSFDIIRIYTKEPRKPATKEPLILKKDSTIKDAAEKILKGMSKKIKLSKIWGPSSKFQGQSVGLNHKLLDKDTVELYVK